MCCGRENVLKYAKHLLQLLTLQPRVCCGCELRVRMCTCAFGAVGHMETECLRHMGKMTQ